MYIVYVSVAAQNGECGDPGDFTHLTSWFVKDPNATEVFGRTDKVMKQWKQGIRTFLPRYWCMSGPS